jgi:dGTPase
LEVHLSATPIFSKPLYSAYDAKRLLESSGDKESVPFRSEWRKDYGRIIHSPSLRRLQGKTQLFPNNENDFYRNRLTHSLEVAQIAKSIAMKINHEHLSGLQGLDLDIVELAALAHDLGHPPFGHNGETSLDECMRDVDGGFEGNAQTFRILARLEKKVTKTKNDLGEGIAVLNGKDNRCGLNLTARSLAAILKYDKKIPARNADREAKQNKVFKGYYECDLDIVVAIKQSVLGIDIKEIEERRIKFKTIECQIMDIADDIAYSTYDLEDAFKAGFLNPLKLVSFGDEFY